MSLKINMPTEHPITQKWYEFEEPFCIFEGELCYQAHGSLFNLQRFTKNINDTEIENIRTEALVELVDVEITVKRRTL